MAAQSYATLEVSSEDSSSIGHKQENIDAVCDLCEPGDQPVQSTGHCSDCKQNLCDSCIKHHKKIPALKGHVIQTKSAPSHPQESELLDSTPSGENDTSDDRCLNHPEEPIKFYCDSHHMFGCGVCMDISHGSCEGISHMQDIPNSLMYSDEMVKVRDDLDMVVAKLTNTKIRASWIKQAVNDSFSKTVSDIRNLKANIIERLDKMEKELLGKAVSMTEKTIDVLDSDISKCEGMIEEAELIIADLKKKISESDNNALFISMKNAQVRVGSIGEEADRVITNSTCKRVSFDPDRQLTDILSPRATMGTVSFISNSSNMQARYQHEIDVKSATDMEDCFLMGACILPDQRLALIDHNNATLKIVDITHRRLSEHVQLASKPLDITVFKDVNIAITLKGQRCIDVLSESPANYYSIPVPGFYSGIRYTRDKFVLLCYEPVKGVHICDMSGVLLQQIETDYGVSRLLTMYSRVAISPDQSVIYITEYEENTMVALTMDGKLISKYSNGKQNRQRGITVDDDGCVYMCSFDTHQIHQLSFCGQPLNVLLTKKDGVKFPLAVAHEADNLYVTSGRRLPTHSSIIKVYRLSERNLRSDK